MLILRRKTHVHILIWALLLNVLLLVLPGYGQLRKLKLSDQMPEFSVANSVEPNDSNRIEFTYRGDNQRVLVVIFLSANQKQSKSAIFDTEKVVGDFEAYREQFDVIGVTSGQEKRMQNLIRQTKEKTGDNSGMFLFTTLNQLTIGNLLTSPIWHLVDKEYPIPLISTTHQ